MPDIVCSINGSPNRSKFDIIRYVNIELIVELLRLDLICRVPQRVESETMGTRGSHSYVELLTFCRPGEGIIESEDLTQVARTAKPLTIGDPVACCILLPSTCRLVRQTTILTPNEVLEQGQLERPVVDVLLVH